MRVALLFFSLGLAASLAAVEEDVPRTPPPRAEEEEEETYRYVPAPPWRSVEVGDYYFRRKRYRAALSRYQEAAELDPYYAPAFLGLGRVYEKIGLREKALENYRKHLDLLPSTKDAEEARDVHKAIERLEKKLKSRKSSR
jgi:tetratricopeptide (TPR) repeat protein